MLDFYLSKKGTLRLVAALAVAVNVNACSSLPDVPDVPDWVDPTTWFGDDSTTVAQPSNTQTADAQQDNTQPGAAPPPNGQAPDLASLPEKPTASSEADQQAVADSLAADRAHAKYSSDVLRGGTEAAAAPPPDIAPTQIASSADTMPAATASKPVKGASAVQASVPHTDQSVVEAPRGPAIPGSLPSPGAATRVASLPAPVQAPAAAPPPGAQPAVPPIPAVPELSGSINPSDAALGFRPSHAPPLDASVSQFVAPTILQRYQTTAANAGLRYANPVGVSPSQRGLHKPNGAVKGMGGPETMTGSVVANLDALQPSSNTPSVYASPQGMPATAVVFFPGDSVALNAEARAQVRAAAEQYKGNGGQGFVRVVGHSSSRTPNMPLERHLEAIFAKSQGRANAVAQELIRDGVPAAKVLVEAVGDSQPVYYESMPKGEDGNRRAEIFFQG